MTLGGGGGDIYREERGPCCIGQKMGGKCMLGLWMSRMCGGKVFLQRQNVNCGLIITCQNLHFGKNVCFSVCLSICLLLAKMFNFGKHVHLTVCYLQNLQFWQVCASDGLFVCVFVCLSISSSIQVTVFYIYLPNLTQICFYVTWPCLVFLGQRSNN